YTVVAGVTCQLSRQFLPVDSLFDGALRIVDSFPTRRSSDLTVGAGDTFNAAVLAAVVDGVPWPEAVALAVEVASRSVAATPRRYPRWTDLRRAGPAARPEGAATVPGRPRERPR